MLAYNGINPFNEDGTINPDLYNDWCDDEYLPEDKIIQVKQNAVSK
nr:hypothetical protein [Moritella viscosa]SHO03605.1 Putative uncharacterized protein [Moritella viscosa]